LLCTIFPPSEIIKTFSQATICGNAVEINISLENVDDSCQSIQCSWTTPEGSMYGNSIVASMAGTYTAQIIDCSGCADSKEIIIIDENIDGGSLISGVSLDICTGDGNDDIIPSGSIAIQNASGPMTRLLIVDYEGQILFMPEVIAEINWDILGEGELLIVNLAYGEDLIGLEVGSNIWTDLVGCNDKSNPLYVNLEDCQVAGPGLPDLIPLNATETSVTLYWDDTNANPSDVTFQYKETAETVWTSINPTDNIVILSNLTSCTEYAFRLESGMAGSNEYSSISYLETAGCAICPTIENLFGFNFSTSTAFLAWDVVIDASYVFHYKQQGQSTWIAYETDFPVVVLFGLSDCTIYDWYVEANCINVDELSSSSTQIMQTLCKDDTIDDSDITLSPNPTSGTIQLSSINEASIVEVIDYTGRVHFTKSLDAGSSQNMNMSNLESGSYLMKISGNSENTLLPFIKE